MNHKDSSFLCGCAPFQDLVFCAKQVDRLADDDKANSVFLAMDGGDWLGYDEAVGWSALDMATLKVGEASRTVVGLGPAGEYWELDSASTAESTGRISDKRVTTRALGVIEQTIYASGMGRVVLRRDGPGKWRSMGPDVPRPKDLTVVGFEAIGGYSGKEIYATGWLGEIWRFNGSSWEQVDSPVSTTLNALTCTDDQDVFIVGDNGLMLRGRGDSWSVLETGRKENLRDVATHEGQIYVSTDFRILKLTAKGLVNETDFAVKKDVPATCLHLLPAADGLISMGPKDLFKRHGGPWERIV